MSISGSRGPVRPRSLGNLRVGVLPSDLLIIGASCVVVNTNEAGGTNGWLLWCAQTWRSRSLWRNYCNRGLRFSWLASKASKHGRFRTVAMFAHGTARDGNSVCSAICAHGNPRVVDVHEAQNSHLSIHSFFCPPPSRSKTRNHGRTHPPHKEDCRQEANQEVRPASVGPVHPHPQLLLEEAQGY